MTAVRRNVNPVLEKIRDEVLKSGGEGLENNKRVGREVVGRLSGLHAGYLFHPVGLQALRTICSVLSSTPPYNFHYSSWRDLAAQLGLTFHQIGCIENYKMGDCTELVLKTFAQKPDASLEKVVQSICDIDRYDVIICAKPHLIGLVVAAEEEHGVKLEEMDSGYSSLNDGQEEGSVRRCNTGELLRPPGGGVGVVGAGLPITLREIQPIASPPPHNPPITTQRLLTSAPILTPPTSKPKKKYSRLVLLSYGDDGGALAGQVSSVLSSHHIGVLRLDEHRDKVLANPNQFIANNYSRMDFIIPILTEGYVKRLWEGGGTMGASSLDAAYAQLIYDLASKSYVENSCRNYKVRCLVPDELTQSIFKSPPLSIDPIFNVYFPFSQIQKLVEMILRSKPRRKVEPAQS